MATLKRCDGCGKTVKADDIEEWDRIEIYLKVMDADFEFDLCDICTSKFIDMFPNRWKRAPAIEVRG